jgi:hypothetical protein
MMWIGDCAQSGWRGWPGGLGARWLTRHTDLDCAQSPISLWRTAKIFVFLLGKNKDSAGVWWPANDADRGLCTIQIGMCLRCVDLMAMLLIQSGGIAARSAGVSASMTAATFCADANP